MSIIEVFLIGVGLSMDAFAVSICKGLSFDEMSWKKALVPGVYFGVFQALMPVAGFFLGTGFEELIRDYDHWVAFGLLALIGINMIRESRDEDADRDPEMSFRAMIPLAVATSIDALAVGISFAVLRVNIWGAAALIGCTTLVISALGFKVGNAFGAKYRSKAELAGGIILILIGIKILIEHIWLS
ncbi:MAG: manganese efflux pump MntP family protein [Clostridia bacterium]|nr:manganese efflux pump MntP family protein [Clostridia bacterium]